MAIVGSPDTGWRLGHRPALDGLRGLAVALVVLSHAGWERWVSAGQVGVTIFFGLSGFLIATLLHQELERGGRVDFARFYARRAARLLPALYAVIAACIVLTLVTGQPWVTPREVIGAATYSSNLLTALGGDRSQRMAVLHHTWSLVIEEQFYLVWPALTLLLWRRRGLLLGLAGAVSLLALVQRIHIWNTTADYDRITLGTDTRVDGILLGCALAVWLRGRSVPSASQGWSWVALGLVAALVLIPNSSAAITVGPTVVSLATVAIVVCVLAGTAPRFLSWGPLTWLGRRSYGLYLWHHPVAVVCLHYGIDGWARAAILVPVSLLLTVLSWRYVEQPVLARRDRHPQKVDRDAQTEVASRVTVTA